MSSNTVSSAFEDPMFRAAWEAECADQDRRSMMGNLGIAAFVQPFWSLFDYVSQPDLWWAFLPGRLLLALYCLALLVGFQRLRRGWQVRSAILFGLWLSCLMVGPTVPGAADLYPLYALGYSLLLWAGGAALGLSPRWSIALFIGMFGIFPLCHLVMGTEQPATTLLGAALFMATAALLCGSSTITRYHMRFDAFVSAFMLQRRNQELAASRLETVGERVQHAAKDAFLERMSHELRTPLNAILGYAELVREEVDDAGMSDAVADMDRVEIAGRHLLDILSTILDLSAIEAGQVPLEPIDLDLADLVRGVVDEVREAVSSKGLVLTLELEDLRVHHDPARVRQIVVALLSNAIRFTDAGEVRLALVAEADDAVLSVIDSGCGIDSNDLARVFAAFEQGDGSTTRRHDGSGLGLAVALGLTKNMGGDLQVHSTVGEGSTFTVRLPILTERTAYPATHASKPTPQPRP